MTQVVALVLGIAGSAIGPSIFGAGFSLFGSGTYGRVIGIIAATLGAIESLLSVGGTHPWWSLALFFLCLYVLHGLIVFSDDLAAAN